MFKPVKKTRIYEDIISRIKVLIEQGHLGAGDRLPSERYLSEAFNVSRPSVREALKTLENQGYLDIRPGEGAYVSPRHSQERVMYHFANILSAREWQIQILELRRMVEPQIASLAAERATREEALSLEGILNLQMERVLAGETGSDLDKIFHFIIAKAARNRLLMHIVDTVNKLFLEDQIEDFQIPERSRRSVRHHQVIFNAIKAGDSLRASQSMYEHINDIHETLFATE